MKECKQNLYGNIRLLPETDESIVAMCSLCGGGSDCSCGSCGICNCGSCDEDKGSFHSWI